MSDTWTCPHGLETTNRGDCSACDDFDSRPDPAMMTPQEKVTEIRDDLFGANCYTFSLVHKRLEALVGRPVWTHEMASEDYLYHEILTGTQPSMKGIIAKLPADMPVIVLGEWVEPK